MEFEIEIDEREWIRSPRWQLQLDRRAQKDFLRNKNQIAELEAWTEETSIIFFC